MTVLTAFTNSAAERRLHDLRGTVLANEEDLGARTLIEDLLSSFDSVELRKSHVHGDKIGLEVDCDVYRLQSVGSLTDNT